MKKPYEKPMILFESFSLSTSIAGDCETIISNVSKGICGYKPDRLKSVFLVGVTGCEVKVADDPYTDTKNNTFCYHVPTEYMNLFNS